MAYLIKTSGKSSDELFETDNFIPVFWFSLLDIVSVEAIKNELINSYNKVFYEEQEEEYYTIKLSKSKFIANLNSGKIFFENYYADKINLYNAFINYLDKTFNENDILELNILEIGYFGCIEDLINDILNIIKNIGSNVNKFYRFKPNDTLCYSFVGFCDNEFVNYSKEYSEYFINQMNILKSLYEMNRDDLINDVINFEIEYSKNETDEDYYFWPNSSYMGQYFQSKGLNAKHLYIPNASLDKYQALTHTYYEANLLRQKVMERFHYEKIMSHIDECIEWGGERKSKFTLADINNFFSEKKIKSRYKAKLKHIFYLKTNEKLKKGGENIIYDEKEEDQYVIPYLANIKPFSTPLDYTKYEFKGKIYAKKWLVLAVISEHLRLHPQVSLEKLREDFLITNRWGSPVEILYDYNYVRKRGLELHCLFDNPLFLSNGEKIFISECGTIDIINVFNKKAKGFGYEIKAIEQY